MKVKGLTGLEELEELEKLDNVKEVVEIENIQGKAEQIVLLNGDTTHYKCIKNGVAMEPIVPGDMIAACTPFMVIPMFKKSESEYILWYCVMRNVAPIEWIDNVLEHYKDFEEIIKKVDICDIMRNGDEKQKRRIVLAIAIFYKRACCNGCGSEIWYPPYSHKLKRDDLCPTTAIFCGSMDSPFKLSCAPGSLEAQGCKMHKTRQLFIAQHPINVGDVPTINKRDPFIQPNGSECDDPHPAAMDYKFSIMETLGNAMDILQSINVQERLAENKDKTNSIWPCIVNQQEMLAIRLASKQVTLGTEKADEILKVLARIFAPVMISVGWPYYVFEAYYHLLLVRVDFGYGSMFEAFSITSKRNYILIENALKDHLEQAYGGQNIQRLIGDYMDAISIDKSVIMDRVPVDLK